MSGLISAGTRLLKLLLKSKLRGGVVRLQDIYTLALSEMSKTLGTPPPPGATLTGEVERLQEQLPKANAILEAPAESDFSVENPVQAMRLLSFSLETGIDRKMTVSARTLRALDEFAANDSIPDDQKEKIIQLAVESYLVGLLAPVIHLDMFEKKTGCVGTGNEISHSRRDAG